MTRTHWRRLEELIMVSSKEQAGLCLLTSRWKQCLWGGAVQVQPGQATQPHPHEGSSDAATEKGTEPVENPNYHNQHSFLLEVNLLEQLNFYLKSKSSIFVILKKKHVNSCKIWRIIHNLKTLIKIIRLVRTINTKPFHLHSPPMKKANCYKNIKNILASS